MNVGKLSILLLMMMAAAGYAASPDDESALVAEERTRWTFSVGPAWRSRVKMETSGRIRADESVSRETQKRDMTDSANWGQADAKLVPHPSAGTGTLDVDDQLWGINDNRVEIYGYAGRDYVINTSEEQAPLGVSIQAGYEIYGNETVSVELALRFAGYWDMKSSTCGRFNNCTKVTEEWTDHYVFPEEAPDAPFSPDPDYGTIAENGTTLESVTVDDGGSRTVSTRFRGDLYQIGIGPKLTWSPFADETSDGWLALYCGVELLGNFAYSRFSADGHSDSDTTFLLGGAAMLGFVGNITDYAGIYGQIGYEWIDDTEVSVGGFRSRIDYSSLVIATGLNFRF